MSIRLKLTALAVVLTLLTAGVVGVASYRILERALIDSAFERLAMLRHNQVRSLQAEYQDIERALTALTYTPGLAALIRQMTTARAESAAADAFGPLVRSADTLLLRPLEELGFDDVYIVLADGFVAYSARRLADFATVVTADGDLRGSGLQWVYDRVAQKRRVAVTPPEAYLPADNREMLFAAQPILDGDSLLGVVVARVSAHRIARLLDASAGLGASGEAYLVGPDTVTRGSSRTFDSAMTFRNLVRTPVAEAALAGRSGQATGPDYRGIATLSAYGPFEYRNVTLGLVAEISETEILAPLRDVAIDVLRLVAGVALVMMTIGLLIANSLARPLVRLSAALQSFGQTRRLSDLPYTRRRDEIGAIARVVAEAGKEIEKYLTRQEAAQAALRRSEAQFKAVVDQLPSGIALRDDGGGYLFINETQRQWFAVDSPFEIIGAQPDELFDAETVDALERLEDQARTGAVVREQEMTIAWPDGQRRTMLLTKFPLLSEGGELLAIGTVATDVSAIRQAEADLRLALTHLPGGIYKTGPDQKLQLYNDNFKRLLSYPDGMVRIGMSAAELREYRRVRGDTIRTLAGNIPLPPDSGASTESLAPDDPLVSEETVGERILEAVRSRTPDGGMVGVVRDITERRRAEEALTKSEERFRTIVDQLPNAVIVKDTEGRYELVNAAYCHWYGIDDPRQAMGRTAAAYIAPEAYAIVAQMERQIVDQRAVVRRELQTQFADREAHTLISSQFPLLTPDGTLFGLGTVLTDITEQKQAEQRLAHALGQVRESVDYAGRIQRALLPDPYLLKLALGDDHFVVWEPKDGVGGDLFWARHDDNGSTLCLFDCTGHGVPGALMTTIAIAALNNAYEDDRDPAALIAGVNRRIKDALGQVGAEGDSDDGLEMGVVWLPKDGNWLVFAGARFPLLVMADGEARIVAGDRSGVGYRRVPADQCFANHQVDYDPGASIYMFTDGITDQIGGDKRRAFGRKRLLEILHANRRRPMSEQREAVLGAFRAYQGDEQRRDDVSMIGIRLPG